jgi:hypothetical protein
MSILRDWYDDLSVSMDLSRFDFTLVWRRWAFGTGARHALYRHLASQRANGITVEIALEKYRNQLTKRGKKTVASVIQDIESRYNNAKSFPTALMGYVPMAEAVLIDSGERSANLSAVLERMLETAESTKKVQRVLITALIPPIVYLWALWGVLMTIGGQVVPSMMQGRSTHTVHGLAYMVMEIGFIATSPLVIIPPLGTAALTALLIWSLPRWTGKYRRIADHFFPFSYYRDLQGFMWLIATTSLKTAGMDLRDALRQQIQLASPWLRERLTRIEWLYGTATRSFPDSLMESGYEFPSPGLIDDIASLSEFSDFAERINQRTKTLGQDLEYAASQKVMWSGLIFEFIIFAVIAAVTQGIDELANTMGTSF